MSVLLEALKRAAQEKKARDALLAKGFLEADGDDDTHNPDSIKKGDTVDVIEAADYEKTTPAVEPEAELEPTSKESDYKAHQDENIAQAIPTDNSKNADEIHQEILSVNHQNDRDASPSELVDNELSLEPIDSGEELSQHAESLELTIDESILEDEQYLKRQNDNITSNQRDEHEACQYKNAVDHLNKLNHKKRQGDKTKKIIALLLISVISILSVLAYYFISNDYTHKKLGEEENFNDYVERIDDDIAIQDNVELSEGVISSVSPEKSSIDITDKQNTLPSQPTVDSTDSFGNNSKATDENNLIKEKEANNNSLEEGSISGNQEKSITTLNEEQEINTIAEALQAEYLALQKKQSEIPATELKNNNDKVPTTPYIKKGKAKKDEYAAIVQKAYRYYNDGVLDEAKILYDQALRLGPNKRDALLGAAAVAVRQERTNDALTYYQRVLTTFPQDNHAQAGLIGLQGHHVRDPKWLTQINQLLIQYPDSAYLYFLKANVDAYNGRWDAAQQSYFDAWSRNPNNPDFAYNLAISLDQLNQKKPALEYYRKSLTLSRRFPNNIPVAKLALRIAQLEGVEHGL